MRPIALLLPLALAGVFAAPAMAQTLLDIGALREIDNAEIRGADGTEIGDIEDVLVDAGGTPVAVVVEIERGFLQLDDEDVVFALGELTYENGNYLTAMTAAQIEALPRYDD